MTRALSSVFAVALLLSPCDLSSRPGFPALTALQFASVAFLYPQGNGGFLVRSENRFNWVDTDVGREAAFE